MELLFSLFTSTGPNIRHCCGSITIVAIDVIIIAAIQIAAILLLLLLSSLLLLLLLTPLSSL